MQSTKNKFSQAFILEALGQRIDKLNTTDIIIIKYFFSMQVIGRGFFLDVLTLEDQTDTFSQKIRHQ
jgi:hypothetical protein